ncbi:MAG: glycogen synthase GlgA [Ruminococcaceae bacterium]|nr:glycogen synthase GlgA [Oscillospiraceae bacterium]
MKKILFVGAEALPFAATGGLGDVLGSLPKALKDKAGDDVDIRVVMPLYDKIGEKFKQEMKFICSFTVPLSWRNLYCGVKSLELGGVTYYFIDNEFYFKRGPLYGHYDDGERYAYFCKAVLIMMSQIDFFPDILHAHDWQAALSVVYAKRKFASLPGYCDMKTVFTIHNIEYQGKYDFAILGDVFDMEESDRNTMEYGDCINLMKGAIQCADAVSTVSPRYAEEIKTQDFSHGLHYILRENEYKLRGILNGIDTELYNPKTDPTIACNFTDRSLGKKTANKMALQREVGLPESGDVPMYAIITRLASHKGIDLVKHVIGEFMNESEAQLVVLGTGDKEYENFFLGLEEAYPEKVRALITYDRDLAKRIYASADMFIMPSKSEPCGLAQMIASRYGTVPIVRETGGLYDSIKPYWEDGKKAYGNGFTFANYNAHELLDRLRAAYELYHDTTKWAKLVRVAMKTDFSWDISAQKYLEMYDNL